MSLLSCENLRFSRGTSTVLENIDLDLAAGEMLGLIGPNGAGKSTLLKLLCGLLTAERGEIRFRGQSIVQLEVEARARNIGYLEQNGEACWPLTVDRILALGRLPHLARWQQPEQYDQAILERVRCETGLDGFAERTVNTLSVGERARVLLARALVGEPDILLADEPVAALDPGHQLDVMQLLKDYSQRRSGVLVVLHDLSLAAHYCDRLLLLNEGRIVVSGDPSKVLAPEHLSHTFGIRSRTGEPHQPWKRIG